MHKKIIWCYDINVWRGWYGYSILCSRLCHRDIRKYSNRNCPSYPQTKDTLYWSKKEREILHKANKNFLFFHKLSGTVGTEYLIELKGCPLLPKFKCFLTSPNIGIFSYEICRKYSVCRSLKNVQRISNWTYFFAGLKLMLNFIIFLFWFAVIWLH